MFKHRDFFIFSFEICAVNLLLIYFDIDMVHFKFRFGNSARLRKEVYEGERLVEVSGMMAEGRRSRLVDVRLT